MCVCVCRRGYSESAVSQKSLLLWLKPSSQIGEAGGISRSISVCVCVRVVVKKEGRGSVNLSRTHSESLPSPLL